MYEQQKYINFCHLYPEFRNVALSCSFIGEIFFPYNLQLMQELKIEPVERTDFMAVKE